AMSAMTCDLGDLLLQRSRHKRRNVFLQFSQRRVLDIHHVSRAVIPQTDPCVLGGVERHVIEGVPCREVRSGQVVVSRADEKLHEWILVEGVFQRLSRVREASALYAPVPFVEAKAAAEDVVLEIGFVAKLRAYILVEHGGVGRTDGAHAGIELSS